MGSVWSLEITPSAQVGVILALEPLFPAPESFLCSRGEEKGMHREGGRDCLEDPPAAAPGGFTLQRQREALVLSVTSKDGTGGKPAGEARAGGRKLALFLHASPARDPDGKNPSPIYQHTPAPSPWPCLHLSSKAAALWLSGEEWRRPGPPAPPLPPPPAAQRSGRPPNRQGRSKKSMAIDFPSRWGGRPPSPGLALPHARRLPPPLPLTLQPEGVCARAACLPACLPGALRGPGWTSRAVRVRVEVALARHWPDFAKGSGLRLAGVSSG